MELGSKLAEYLRQGADTLTNLPTEAQRFLSNPQAFTQLITGKNPLPKETGFVAGASGLPPKNPVQGGVLNPASAPYQEGYEQGEPVAIAAMALPAYATALRAGAPKAYNALENYMVKSGGMIPLEAYHGTPHNIQGKFDINKVGTGEGAQAYGHGMYFAESPKVADEYRKNLSGYVNNSKGVLNRNGGDFDKAIEETRNRIYEYNTRNFAETDKPMAERMLKINEKKLEELQAMKAGIPESTGNLYKVDIPDEQIPNMLDYDKPLSQQSPEVQKILKNMGMTVEMTGQDIYRFMPEQMQGQSLNFSKRPTDADVSKYLNEQGIKGIRYLDESSRGNYQAQTTYKGKPYSDMLSFKTKDQLDDFIKEKEAEGFGVKTFPQTNNFVVFEPSTVKILEENGKPLTRKALIQEQITKID